jgi:hypothetical protein
MAQDLGLHKLVGTEEERERIDTFWTLYFLDRVISAGRYVTLKDSEIEITMPSLDEADNYPQPFPALIRVIHLYGKATDILLNNTITKRSDDTSVHALAKIEKELVQLSPKPAFNVSNFQYYDKAHQSSVFILLHFWFHALNVLLHGPTFSTLSSAKATADIVELLEDMGLSIKVAGNPFTSHPIYIAACVFLQESATSVAPLPGSQSRYITPNNNCESTSEPAFVTPRSQHSFNPQQHYQYCCKALKNIEQYWNGVKYMMDEMESSEVHSHHSTTVQSHGDGLPVEGLLCRCSASQTLPLTGLKQLACPRPASLTVLPRY